jgi:DNA-3-methyladenine glycosylase
VGWASAVLLRALEPVDGVDAMRARRPAARADTNLTSGPAKLCGAFGIDGKFDGADLVSATDGIAILDDGVAPPVSPAQTPRIGLTAGAEHPWRWCVRESAYLSRRLSVGP